MDRIDRRSIVVMFLRKIAHLFLFSHREEDPLWQSLGGGDADDATSDAGTGVPGGEGEFVPPPAQVVFPREDDDAPADDRMGADELHEGIFDVDRAGPVLRDLGRIFDEKTKVAYLDVPEVTDHPILGVGSPVVLPERIKDAPGARQALAKITKNMHVDPVEPHRETRHGTFNDRRRLLARLR